MTKVVVTSKKGPGGIVYEAGILNIALGNGSIITFPIEKDALLNPLHNLTNAELAQDPHGGTEKVTMIVRSREYVAICYGDHEIELDRYDLIDQIERP